MSSAWLLVVVNIICDQCALESRHIVILELRIMIIIDIIYDEVMRSESCHVYI